MILRGHCLCKSVRFETTGTPIWVLHCHCESCRRQTASAFTTFYAMASGQWRWTGVEPSVYHSSPGAERFFCPICGAPAAYRNEVRFPGEMHFYAALLEDPVAVTPTGHVYSVERIPWVHIDDGLTH